MADLKEMRIVLLGRTGYGKSSSGNTILGDTSSKFLAMCSPTSVTSKCEVQTSGREGKETQIKIIDTPGFFDTRMTEEELKVEIVKCIVTSAPGPHAFIIVLSVGKFTEQETATVAEITRSFGERAFKYSAVLFTHGNDLDEGQTIEQFVEQSKELKELVEKCGGGCHVIDNKYWNQENGDKNNRVQVEQLLNTIEKMVRQNGGGCYTNSMLQVVEEGIQREEEEIRNENPNEKSVIKIRAKAIEIFVKKLLVQCAGLTTGALVGALLGVGTASCVAFILAGAAGAPLFSTIIAIGADKTSGAVAAAVESVTRGPGAVNARLYVAGGIAAVSAAAGAIGGGIMGFQAVEDGDTVHDAAEKAVSATWENSKCVVAKVEGLASKLKDSEKASKKVTLKRKSNEKNI